MGEFARKSVGAGDEATPKNEAGSDAVDHGYVNDGKVPAGGPAPCLS
jgi:hypothetical protein